MTATLNMAVIDELLALIKTCGLAPAKAKNLSAMAELLVAEHAGQVPRTFEELEALPGVGHKTASVVMCQAFGVPAFPVDTHIHRLAERWGLSDGGSVERTERDLKARFPTSSWNALHLRMIYFGREHCPALRHDLSRCPICAWAADPKLVAKSAAEHAVRAATSPRGARAQRAPSAVEGTPSPRVTPRSAPRRGGAAPDARRGKRPSA